MSIREEVVDLLKKRSAALLGLGQEERDAMNEKTRFVEDLHFGPAAFVLLSAALENEFEIEVTYQYIAGWRNFGDAADYIATVLGE